MMKYLYYIIGVILFTGFVSAKGKDNQFFFPTESKFIHDACLSADGNIIVCTDNNTLKAFSLSDRVMIGNFTGGHRTYALCVDMSPNGALLVSGGSDSTIILRDFNSHTIIQQITSLGGKITSIKFSPDNQFILFGCSNSLAYLYNIKEQKIIKEFSDQKMDVTSVAFSPNGNLIAVAGGDKIIRIYNTGDYQLKSELKGHTGWVRSVAFYNQDQNLISCGDDSRIIQWNLSKHKNKITRVFTGWALCVDVEDVAVDNSNLYVSGSINGAIYLKYSFGSYKTKLPFPVSRVITLPNESGLIELAVATLGYGLLYLNAKNMQMSNN